MKGHKCLMVPVIISFLVYTGCRQMTEFFSKTSESGSPSGPVSTSPPTEGKALASSLINMHHIETVSKILSKDEN